MKLYVVGIGCGSREGMTLEAEAALRASRVIVGYTVYVELLRPHFPEKIYHTTAMGQERERVALACRLASQGETVSLVCSGDSAVYGMAGLALQLCGRYPAVEVAPVAGVTAALSGGAVLGAPLTHDFAVISLSDLLTPPEKITARLEAAAQADFTVVLYNPSSGKRRDFLQKACDILLRCRPPETVCGYVKNIGRAGETHRILSLAALRTTAVDMFTTVYIGNSETVVIGGKMVTPRGYKDV